MTRETPATDGMVRARGAPGACTRQPRVAAPSTGRFRVAAARAGPDSAPQEVVDLDGGSKRKLESRRPGGALRRVLDPRRGTRHRRSRDRSAGRRRRRGCDRDGDGCRRDVPVLRRRRLSDRAVGHLGPDGRRAAGGRARRARGTAAGCRGEPRRRATSGCSCRWSRSCSASSGSPSTRASRAGWTSWPARSWCTTGRAASPVPFGRREARLARPARLSA